MAALGQADAQVARASAANELAQAEHQRARLLAAGGSLTSQALEQAEFSARMHAEELASARFAAQVAREQVRLFRATLLGDGGGGRSRPVPVLAPVSGQVLRVLQQSAGVVQAGTPLLEVGDPRALEVVVDLLTTDAVKVHPGTSVAIKGWGGETALMGRVRRIEPAAFTKLSALGVEEQRVNVIVALTDTRAERAPLGDGFRVQVNLVLWQGDGVVKIPQGAAFRHGDGWAVFAVADKRARLVPVTIGQRGETEVEVRGGVSPGAQVAVHPSDRVKDGARVDPR